MLAIEDLLALVSARARWSDEARRLDVDVVAGVAAAGINRALVPSALGGSEVHPGELFEVIARIAAADGSTGWCTSISAGSNLFSGYVPEAVARETFDDPDAGSAAVFASAGLVTSTVVNGGAHAVMTGRWPFASNCLHSRWIALGAKVQDERGNVEDRPRLVFVPAADITVEDTWHADGLRATGSHHVRTESLAVDLNRSCTFTDRPWPEGPLWRMPLFSVLGPLLVAVLLGIARGAVDEVERTVREGGDGAARGRLDEDLVGLSELAAADANLRAAFAGVLRVVDEVWTVASAGQRAAPALQARLMLAVQHAADVSVAVTSVAHRLSGGAAAYAGHRVLASLRDVETARQHILFSHQHRPALMRIASGVQGVVPPFVV